MESYKELNNSLHNYSKAHKSLAIITFCILSIRGCLGFIGIDTIFFTILLNVLIIFSINYRKVNVLVLLVPFLSILIIVNKQILGFVDIILMCIILRNENIEKLAKLYFVILIFFIPVWLSLLNLGYIKSERYFDPAKGGEFYDYGFYNPNGLGIFGFHILATLSVIYKSKINIIGLVSMILINQLFYSLSLSRTAWTGGAILIFSIILFRIHDIKNWMKYPLAILPPIITASLVYLSKNAFNFMEIDLLTSGRLTIYGSILNGMSKFNWIIGTKLPEGPLDGSYMMILFYGGLLVSVIYWFLNYRMMIYYYNKIIIYIPFIIGIMACGMMETTFSSCGGLSILYWYLLINPNHISNMRNMPYRNTLSSPYLYQHSSLLI